MLKSSLFFHEPMIHTDLSTLELPVKLSNSSYNLPSGTHSNILCTSAAPHSAAECSPTDVWSRFPERAQQLRPQTPWSGSGQVKCDGRSDLGSQCFVMEKKKRVCFTYRFEVLGVRLADRFEWGGASVRGGSGRRPSSPLSTEKAPLPGRRPTDLPGLWSWLSSGRARKALIPSDIRKPLRAGPKDHSNGLFSWWFYVFTWAIW